MSRDDESFNERLRKAMAEQNEAASTALRDHFAGLAMQGIIAQTVAPVFEKGTFMAIGVARLSYGMADAMLAARSKAASVS